MFLCRLLSSSRQSREGRQVNHRHRYRIVIEIDSDRNPIVLISNAVHELIYEGDELQFVDCEQILGILPKEGKG